MLTFPSDYPPLLQHAAEVIYDGLIQRGIDDAAAAEIAIGCGDELRVAWGGHPIYLTKGAWMLTTRDREIYAAFDGRNQDQLARRYELTVRRIEQIVTRVRAEMIKEKQGVLAL